MTHIVVETVEGNLSAGMRQLNGVYTQWHNRTHGRVGHVFRGRFRAVVVQRGSYLLELARYVVLNPVRAGLCALPPARRGATACYSIKIISKASGLNDCAVIRAVRSAEKNQAQAGQDAEVATMPAIVATSAS